MECPICGADMEYVGECIDPPIVMLECPKCGHKENIAEF